MEIQKESYDFLRGLKRNNNRDWFEKHKSKYEGAKTNFLDVTAQLIKGISVFDPAVKDLEAKNSVFRIYRDVRFSKDKTPYKTHLAASVNPGGKKTVTAGYYIHIEPGASFLAGGIYRPPAPELNAIRQEIDYNSDEFRKILRTKAFTQFFGKLDEEDKLKVAPRNYGNDHPELELLKYKSYIVVHALKDTEVFHPQFLKHCVKVFQAMYPLNAFLRRALD